MGDYGTFNWIRWQDSSRVTKHGSKQQPTEGALVAQGLIYSSSSLSVSGISSSSSSSISRRAN